MNSGRNENTMLDYLSFEAKKTLKEKNKTDFFLMVKEMNALSPIECSTLQTAGVVLVILFVANIVSNAALLYMFKTYKHLKTNMSTVVIALTVLNLIGTTFTLPFVIASNLMCKYVVLQNSSIWKDSLLIYHVTEYRWLFSRIGCIISGFLMYFVTCTSMYLMAAISVDRFFSIKKPMQARNMHVGKRLLVVLACALLALFWSSMPLVGWSHYTLEPSKTSCAVEWSERSHSVTSYNFAMFIFVFVTPLTIIVLFNFKVAISLNSIRNKNIGVKFKYSATKETTSVETTTLTANHHSMRSSEARVESMQMALLMISYVGM